MHFIRRPSVTFALVLNNQPLVLNKYPLYLLYIFRSLVESYGERGWNTYANRCYVYISARLFDDLSPLLKGTLCKKFCDYNKPDPCVIVNYVMYPAGTHFPVLH